MQADISVDRGADFSGVTSRHRGWCLAAGAVALAGIALRVWAFSPFDISHADELMQYLEQGNRLATGHGIVPWEYRYGARNALVPQLLSVPLWLGHRLAPGTLTAMFLARASFATLCLGVLPAAWRLGAMSSRAHALVALFVAAVWWESVLFCDLLLSESLATALLLLAAPLLLAEKPSPRAYRLAGLLLGLGVLVRLQYGVFAGVLALAAFWPQLRGGNWRALGQLVLGGALALAIGAASDLAMGRMPFGWIAMNFAMNVDAGRAARFGAAGPLEYVRLLLIHLGPAAPFILVGAVLAGARYRPLLLAALANILVHTLIAHKEYRFIWLSTLSLLVLAAIASVRLVEYVAAQRGLGARGRLVALGILCAAWAGLSLAASAQTGGMAAMRGGGAIPRLGVAAARSPAVCGIAVPDQWRAHLVPALLPREVPLFVAPAAVMGKGAPLPPELAGAANALVFPELPQGDAAFRRIACIPMPLRQACLFVRPGICTPAPQWSYQRALQREDL